jgi:uncharacterized protein YdhG (YjbR/CyaY superfamily)
MKSNTIPAENVDAYIARFAPATQKLLKQLRTTIKKAAPLAEEVISYGMPAYKYHGILVYFAGYEHHIGFYPTASGIENFKKEIAGFKHSKGAIQFAPDKPLPLSLVTALVKFRIQLNQEKASIPLKKKK